MKTSFMASAIALLCTRFTLDLEVSKEYLLRSLKYTDRTYFGAFGAQGCSPQVPRVDHGSHMSSSEVEGQSGSQRLDRHPRPVPSMLDERVCPWASVVCSIGVYRWLCIGVQIRDPYSGPIGKPFGLDVLPELRSL